VEVSKTGGVFTILAYMGMLAVLTMELVAFLRPAYTTTMMLDRMDGDQLQINFDVDMHDIDCRNLHVAVFAQGNEERLSSQDFWLRPINQEGKLGSAMRPNTLPEDEEDVHQKQMLTLKKEDGAEELDSDWDSSHDGFNHGNFEHVVQAHDYTFINFFAGWCSHCKNFAPMWAKIAEQVNAKKDGTGGMLFKDKYGVERSVRMLKMNCVDFKFLCMQKGIDAFPTLRLYKSDGTLSVYQGRRTETSIMDFITQRIAADAGWADHHKHFDRGCNAKGRLLVPRVPGRLELMAGTAGDQNLDPKFANISHLVKHLSFSDPADGRYHRKWWSGLPKEVAPFISPLDDTQFVLPALHQTYEHDLKVVSTVSARGQTVYQFSHQKRVARIDRDSIPQARFHYDIEPFSIWIRYEGREWYDFLTSLLALTGGTFVVMRLMSRASLATVMSLQRLAKVASGNLKNELALG